MSVGFIGLGNIGKPMAMHLLKLDEPVWVHDVAEAPVAELVAAGAQRASTVAELAGHCRMIGLCVRDDNDVEQLLYGPSGLLAHAQSGAVIAVHSTVTVEALLRWSRDAAARGLELVDAPMTGGASGAEAGTLCYMVGGTTAMLEQCRPVLATSGSRIVHAGGIGAGITMKLCNNLMTYHALAAIDEASRLAKAGGLAIESLIEVGHSNGVVTPQMEAFLGNRERVAGQGPDMLCQIFRSSASLGRKDLAAALKSAAKLNVKLPATERVYEVIEDVFMSPRVCTDTR